MPPNQKPEVKVAYFNNLGVVVEPSLKSREVVEGYMQALSRLLGWNEELQQFNFLTVDVDGRLHVATDQAKVTDVNSSQATVTNVSAIVANPQPLRKSILLYNNGLVTVYFSLDVSVTVGLGMPLNPGVAYETNVWNGAIAMITLAASSDVRILEFN